MKKEVMMNKTMSESGFAGLKDKQDLKAKVKSLNPQILKILIQTTGADILNSIWELI